MEELSNGEQDLVALGAAVGSNCLPCVEHYISEARSAGRTDRQIEDAIRPADGARPVPAQKVVDAALGLLSKAAKQEPGSAVTPGSPMRPRRTENRQVAPGAIEFQDHEPQPPEDPRLGLATSGGQLEPCPAGEGN